MNEQNASKAQCIDLVIESLTDRLNKKLVDLSDINVSLEAIPNIVKTVQNCSNIMYDVNKKCTDVEKGLVELENLIEVLQLQEKQLDRKLEIAMYKEKKLCTYPIFDMKSRLSSPMTIKQLILSNFIQIKPQTI